MLTQAIGTLEVQAPHAGLHDITHAVSDWLDSQRIEDGLLTIFCAHTSASLLIQENAAPAARRDLDDFFRRIAPENPSLYTHNDEGPDDMPAHIRGALTQTQLSVPVQHPRRAYANAAKRAGATRTDGARHLARDFPVRASPRHTGAARSPAPDRGT